MTYNLVLQPQPDKKLKWKDFTYDPESESLILSRTIHGDEGPITIKFSKLPSTAEDQLHFTTKTVYEQMYVEYLVLRSLPSNLHSYTLSKVIMKDD